MTLAIADRILAVRLGWQAECAAVPNAAQHAASAKDLVIHPEICPLTLAACAEFGRKMLRAHVEVLRKRTAPERLPRLATVTIELKIRGKADDAHAVVDAVLDAGTLQDAINDHDVDRAGSLRVESAVMRARGGDAGRRDPRLLRRVRAPVRHDRRGDPRGADE